MHHKFTIPITSMDSSWFTSLDNMVFPIKVFPNIYIWWYSCTFNKINYKHLQRDRRNISLPRLFLSSHSCSSSIYFCYTNQRDSELNMNTSK